MTVISKADRIKGSFEAINRRDVGAAMEAFAEDFILIEPSYDEPQRGRDRLLYFNRLKLHKQLGLLAEEVTT